MKTIRTFARWSLVLAILGFFTTQSLVMLGLVSPDKALAQSIRKEDGFNDDENFVVLDDDGTSEAEGRDEKDDDKFKKKKVVCSLNQSQLDSLRELFPVQVKTRRDDGRTTSLAVIKGTRSTKRSDIYATIGLTKKDCKIMKQNIFFTVFLLPGVS
jgi:hypothetical protein